MWALCCVLLLPAMCLAVPQSSSSPDIKTLSPSGGPQTFLTKSDIMANSADALLGEWEGEHWASLDPEQDRVAISWTNTETDITMQVRAFLFIYSFLKYISGFFKLIQ